MTKSQFVSPEVRSAESEVDDAYRLNALTELPFGNAGWHFLCVFGGPGT
jgi:hypothetical protein